MNINASLIKYLSVCVFGFGLGGLLWGLALYNELPDLEYPFHYLAIASMAVFGGLVLVWPNWHLKNIIKSVLAGLLGWTIGFVTTITFGYYLYLYGIYFSSIFIKYFVTAELSNKFLNLGSNIIIGDLWLGFLLIGVVVGFFYAIFLKIKIWSLIWRAGLGLALGSLIGPIMGNLIGNLFNSLLLSYLITFCLIGIILGKSLAWGIYKQYGRQKK